jgi:hypothetical protein
VSLAGNRIVCELCGVFIKDPQKNGLPFAHHGVSDIKVVCVRCAVFVEFVHNGKRALILDDPKVYGSRSRAGPFIDDTQNNLCR